MTKLCPRGKAAAKRKFKVYPSAYANAYASKICAGKIKDPSGVKRKDFKGPKPAGKAMGGRIGYESGKLVKKTTKKEIPVTAIGELGLPGAAATAASKVIRAITKPKQAKPIEPKGTMRRRENKMGGGLMEATQRLRRQGKMGGGMMQTPRAMYGRGGGVCKRGMGRAYGKNS
jgi:hypothetical protein